MCIRDSPPRPGLPGDAAPLIAVQPGRVEHILRLGAVAPFNIGKCVGAKVTKQVKLGIVPGTLGSSRGWELRVEGGLGKEQGEEETAKHRSLKFEGLKFESLKYGEFEVRDFEVRDFEVSI